MRATFTTRRLPYPRTDELARQLSDSGAKLLFTSDALLPHALKALAKCARLEVCAQSSVVVTHAYSENDTQKVMCVARESLAKLEGVVAYDDVLRHKRDSSFEHGLWGPTDINRGPPPDMRRVQISRSTTPLRCRTLPARRACRR